MKSTFDALRRGGVLFPFMPQPQPPKRQRHEGHGPPLVDEGQIGDHYKDLDTGEIYAKNKAGWSNYARVDLHITIKQKAAWTRAAKGERLDDWAVKALDHCANDPLYRLATGKSGPPKPSDAS